MVYAVATRTIENFDRALGRPMRLAGVGGRRVVTYAKLRLLPHAFYGANAFYSRELNAILFGYFLGAPGRRRCAMRRRRAAPRRSSSTP